MRVRLRARALVAAAATALACDGGGSSLGPPTSDITGTWQATSSVYVSEGAPPQSVDVVSRLGASATLVLDADHTFTYTVTPAGGTAEALSGRWQASADVFTARTSGATIEWQWDYTLSPTTLTLTGANGEYDFNGDGMPEPAKWDLTLSR